VRSFDGVCADAWFFGDEHESACVMLLELNEYRPTIYAAGMPGHPGGDPPPGGGDSPDEEDDEEEASPT
jgi:hypothetical protein